MTQHWLHPALVAALLWSAGTAVAEDATPTTGAVNGTDAAATAAAENPPPATSLPASGDQRLSAVVEGRQAGGQAGATAEHPDAESLYAKGRALYQAGRFDEARAQFAAALQLRPPQAPAAAPAPVATTADTAATPHRTAVPAQTDRVRELYATGRDFYQAGRFEEARAAFAEAVQLQQGAPTSTAVAVQVNIEPPVPEHLQTSTSLQQTHRQRQQALHQLDASRQRLERLRGEIRRLRERVRTMPAQKAPRAKTLERLAQAERAFVERQAEGQRLTQEVERLTEREAVLWYNWGVEADLQHHAGDAIVRYKQAITLNPRHANARYNLATAFLKRRQVGQAEQMYQELLTVDPQDADAHYNLGLIAEEYRRAPREALTHYRAYLELAPPAAPERGLVQGWVSVIEGSRKEGSVE